MSKVSKKLFIMGMLIVVSLLVVSCSKKNDQLDIEFSLGYDDSIKVSDGNPLTAKITNNGKEIIGELQIEVDQTQAESLIFAKEFQIPANSDKEIQMIIPVYTIQRKFKVLVLVDGKRIFEDTITSGSFISPNQPIIGVISDQPDEYRFLQSSKYDSYFGEQKVMDSYYQSFGPTEVEKEETNNPELFYFDSFDEMVNLDNLDFFNYLYIGDNGNLKITEKMEDKLLTWVAGGGTLFVESGEDYKRLYSFVPESITNFQVSSVEEIKLEALFETYSLDAPVKVVRGEPIQDEDVMIYEEDAVPLVVYTRIGQGQVVNLLVDLTDVGLDDWPYKSQIIDEVLKRGVNAQNSLFGNYEIEYNNSYEYYDMLRYIPTDKNPPYGIMAILFTIYVVLVGPVLYYILKRKDRRDLMWIGVPALSLICILLLYVFGFGTRYTKPVVNSISNIEYSEGNDFMNINTKIAVFNNKSGNLSVAWDPDENIEITSNPNSYYGAVSGNKKVKGKILSGNRYVYEVYDSPLWSKVDLDASKVIPLEVNNEGEFITFAIEGDTVHMSIFNKTPFDLETAYIKWGSGYIYLGELLGNETKELSFEMKEIRNDFYDFTNSLMDKYKLYDEKESVMRSNLEMYQRLEGNYYRGPSQNISSDFGSITIKGVNNVEIGYDLLVNDAESENFNRNIISLNTQVVFEPGTELNLPSGFVIPSVKAGFMESELYDHFIEARELGKSVVYVYNEKLVRFTFNVPEYIDVDLIELNIHSVYSDKDYYQKTEFESIQSIPNVVYEIYNTQTESYETADILEEFFDLDQEQYLSESNTIKIQMKLENIDVSFRDYGKVVEVPELSIQGRAK